MNCAERHEFGKRSSQRISVYWRAWRLWKRKTSKIMIITGFLQALFCFEMAFAKCRLSAGLCNGTCYGVFQTGFVHTSVPLFQSKPSTSIQIFNYIRLPGSSLDLEWLLNKALHACSKLSKAHSLFLPGKRSTFYMEYSIVVKQIQS